MTKKKQTALRAVNLKTKKKSVRKAAKLPAIFCDIDGVVLKGLVP